MSYRIDRFSTKRLCALVLALVIVLSMTTVGPVAAEGDENDRDGTADGDGDAIAIDSCTVIDEPGEYVLSEDIEDAEKEVCIEIDSANVTVDGGGHTIDGVDANDTVGIRVNEPDQSDEDPTNVTIENVTVTDWERGVYYQFEADEGTVSGVRAESNRVGLSFNENARHTVSDVVASNNDDSGIAFFFGGGSTITNVTANDNGGDGLVLDEQGNDRVRNVTANDNGFAGIRLSDSRTTRLTDITTAGNERGFSLRFTERVTIENATATNNTEWAFYSSGVFGAENETNTAENVTIDSATISFVENKVGIAAVDEPPADPEGLQNVDQYVNVTDADDDADLGVALDVHYDDADVPASVDEESLRLYRYVDGNWEEIPESSVDTDANLVSGNVTEFDNDSLVVAPLGQLDGDDGVFAEPIVLEFAGSTVSIGPPTDPDGDGVYEDVTGDGSVDVVDAFAHAVVVTAVERGELDLTSEQADALDVDRDGEVDYNDARTLLEEPNLAS